MKIFLKNCSNIFYILMLTSICSSLLQCFSLGYDVIGQAETGSGKTAAFILPIIDNITKTGSSSACSPIALTVAPTRELVLQLYDQARKLASGKFFQSNFLHFFYFNDICLDRFWSYGCKSLREI